MKSWKKTLLIGVIIALTSQLYWNVFVDNFRISTSVILLPILIMTLGMQIHTRTICVVTALIVYVFRISILLLRGGDFAVSAVQVLPNALFYISYGLIFKLLIRNKHIVKIERLIVTIFICDMGSNVLEVCLQEWIQQGALRPAGIMINYLFFVACVRTLLAGLFLIAEQQYRVLLKKSEHENRYQRLFLMTTGLKNEIYLMRKNTDEIERVMSSAYRLYEQISDMEHSEQMAQMALSIARDVHEIKKDYIRIIQGVEEEIDEEYDEEKMSFQDLLKILEASTYSMLRAKKLNVRLLFDCRDDFTTREHYILMAVLKNLVNNAIEAIETKGSDGEVYIKERKENDHYVFVVKDDGPGISDRHLQNIFKMGYSTKFDEKTGNIYRGVGLCGVKDAVEEQFGGTIEVQSEKGAGTTFCVEIPADKLEES